MSRTPLTMLLAGLALVACQEASDPQFTPQPATMFEPRPGLPIVDGGRMADAGDGGTADGGDAGDGGAADAGEISDAAPDAMPDAAPDAQVDYICNNDQDCVLAVRLSACEPCPVAAHVDEVLADRCVAVYIEGATLGTYAPADCWADCGDRIGEACFEGPVAAVCDPPRQAGQCTLFR